MVTTIQEIGDHRPRALPQQVAAGDDWSWTCEVVDLAGAPVDVSAPGTTITAEVLDPATNAQLISITPVVSGAGNNQIALSIVAATLESALVFDVPYRWRMTISGGSRKTWLGGRFEVASPGLTSSFDRPTEPVPVLVDAGVRFVVGGHAAVTGGAGAATDHGALTGLTDNDHPQYAAGTSSPPAAPFLYQQWKQTSTGRLFYWDGTFWVENAGTPPAFNPADYDLANFSGFVGIGQGGFGFSLDQVEGDPAGALAILGGAPAAHGHRVSWKVVTTTTYTILPEDEGKVLLFDIAGGAACAVTLQSQANQPNWQPSIVIGMLAYSAGTVTVTPEAAVNVDGVTATAFTLVQHGMSTLTRMPASNFWNFSGQVGA